MYTRIVLGDNIWFVVDEPIENIVEKFNDGSSTVDTRVVDEYDVSIIKDRIICFVSVNIEKETNEDDVEAD